MSIDRLRKKNPQLNIQKVSEKTFGKFGRIILDYDFSKIIEYMTYNTIIPDEGNLYNPSDLQLEELEIKTLLEREIYGEMPIQIGYCNGRNSKLNGMEYHMGSEINVAVTDLVLLLGELWDIKDGFYDSKSVSAFFLPKGTAVELYSTTLHYAPCRAEEEGFKCTVILPRNTNLPLKFEKNINRVNGEYKMLFAKNKWLIVHSEHKIPVSKGAYVGIIGKNIEVVI